MSKNTELHTLSNALTVAVETAGASVVTVAARRRIPASGVVIRPGIVLTASHVVKEDEIRVVLPDGKDVEAELLGRDPFSDLAVLKLAEEVGQPAQTAEAKVGQLALALGRPGEAVQASLGIVSATGGPVPLRRGGVLQAYLRTDAVPYPGFSGGPLVDVEGRVLGINTSGLGWGAGLTIPAEQAWETAASIEENGGFKRGFLGVRSQLVELSAEARKALKREQPAGLLVMSVEDESPAATAGLIVGDVLTGLGGQPVEDHDELMLQLNGLAGQESTLDVLRGGKPQSLPVTVGEQVWEGRRRRHGRGFGGRRFGTRSGGHSKKGGRGRKR
ncbi:MAG: trypsin-like peptidase domain-containing protein [Anaerolineales bacterium]|nr:trypsin-like peptidase domain-containing protein [Anaerolineales bacterium]